MENSNKVKQLKKISKKALALSVLSVILILSVLSSITYAAFSASATASGSVAFQNNIIVMAYSNVGVASGNKNSTVNYELNIENTGGSNAILTGDKTGDYKNITYGRQKKTNLGLEYSITSDETLYIGFEIEIKYVPSQGKTFQFKSADNFNIMPTFRNLDFEEIYYGENFDSMDYSYTYPSSKILQIATHGGKLLTDSNLAVTQPYLSSGTANSQPYYTKTYRMYFTKIVDYMPKDTNIKFSANREKLSINFDQIIGNLKFVSRFNSGATGLITKDAGRLYASCSCRVETKEFYDEFKNPNNKMY